MREYSPRLHRHLRSYAGTDVDADDLLQEVWLRAYRKRRTFASRGSFYGWLLMVSRTVGMAAVGRRRRAPVAEQLHDIAVECSDPDAGMLRDSLRNAVLDLPPRQREVVLLRLVEGRTTAETAQLLECAEGTVKAALHHAIHKLRELLKETVQ